MSEKRGTRSALLLLGLALLAACACGDRGSESERSSAPSIEVWISEALDASRAWHRADPAGRAPVDSAVFVAGRTIDSLANPATRPLAREQFFTAWEREPGNLLWLKIARSWAVELEDFERIDSLLALPELQDLSTTVGQFVQGKFFAAPDTSVRCFRRALELGASLAPLERQILTLSLIRALTKAGKGEEALDQALEMLPESRWIGGAALEAKYWRRIAGSLRRLGKAPLALHAYSRADSLFSVASHQVFALDCRMECAILHEQVGDPLRTPRMLQAVRTEAERLGFPYLKHIALHYLSSFYTGAGEPLTALAIDREVAAHFVAVRDSSSVPKSYLNLADDYMTLGQLDSAHVALREAKRWAEASPRHGHRWAVYQEEADYRLLLGQYEQADSLSHLAEHTDAGWRDPEDEVLRLSRLAVLGRELGRPEISHRALEELSALKDSIYTELPGVDFPCEIELLRAELRLATGEHEKADLYLAIARDSLIRRPSHVRAAKYWELEAELSAALEDRSRALEGLDSALAAAEASRRPALVSQQHLSRAQLFLEEGRLNSAAAQLDEVGLHLERDPGFKTIQLRRLLQAEVLAAQGGHRESAQLLRETLDEAGDRMPPDLAAHYHITLGHSLEHLGRPEQALHAQETACSLLAGRQRALGQSELRFMTVNQIRDAYLARIGILAARPELCRGQDTARETLRLWQEMLDVSWGRSPRNHLVLPKELTLVFALGEEAGHLWLVDSGEVLRFPLSDSGTITEDAETLQQLVRRPREVRCRDCESRLAERLLAPLAGRWAPGEPLQVLPDGALHGLPWPLLPWEGKEVLDHAPVVEVVGLPEGNELPLSVDPGGELLAMGFNGDGAGGQPILRHAEAEAESVVAAWSGESELFVSEEARGEVLLRLFQRSYEAIHVSVHGRVHQGRYDESYLKLASSAPGAPGVSVRALREQRLDTKLVFLSCCEVSRGASSRRGPILDLARGFLGTGAHGVIASSRRIEDEASAEFSRLFYLELSKDGNPAQALRRVRLRFRDLGKKTWRTPYYWTPLVLRTLAH